MSDLLKFPEGNYRAQCRAVFRVNFVLAGGDPAVCDDWFDMIDRGLQPSASARYKPAKPADCPTTTTRPARCCHPRSLRALEQHRTSRKERPTMTTRICDRLRVRNRSPKSVPCEHGDWFHADHEPHFQIFSFGEK